MFERIVDLGHGSPAKNPSIVVIMLVARVHPPSIVVPANRPPSHSFPNIHFQVRTVSFSQGKCSAKGVLSKYGFNFFCCGGMVWPAACLSPEDDVQISMALFCFFGFPQVCHTHFPESVIYPYMVNPNDFPAMKKYDLFTILQKKT